MQDPILITGAARSGTSLTAGIISRCGAFGGETSGPNRYNPKGMFENTAIREKLVKPYLLSLGVDPKGQYPLPDVANLTQPLGWRKFIEDTMVEQGYKTGPWYYKGAKMCLIYPIWVHAFPDAKWVIVRRSKADIVNSCMRTGFMRAYKDEAGWGRWVDHHLWCFDMMKRDLGDRVVEFWPSEIFVGDNLEPAETLVKSLGLPFDRRAVSNFVERRLYNGG